MSTNEAFADRLRQLVSEDRRPTSEDLTERYWVKERFTGQLFHRLAATDCHDEITAKDIVAVSTLGVTIPGHVAIWLLREGQDQVTKLLAGVPVEVDIWHGGEHLTEGSPLWQLWDLLDSACWPEPDLSNDMGPTKISKLLATKRPRLVPIYDSVVASAFPGVPLEWQAFHDALADPDLRGQAARASAAGAPEDTSLLRRLDALLWMIGREPG